LLKEPTIPPELCYGCSPNGNGGKYPNN
jgi:hypothetical protein